MGRRSTEVYRRPEIEPPNNESYQTMLKRCASPYSKAFVSEELHGIGGQPEALLQISDV